MRTDLLDPFGDYETKGYLRNVLGSKDVTTLHRVELAAFSDSILPALLFLQRQSLLEYTHVLRIHNMLFKSVYPWAGQDRLITAPAIAISKAGISTMFAHPKAIRRAADYALSRGQDTGYFRLHPGEVYCYLAHAHPFLEGNGRTILTVHDELCRRAAFHVRWQDINTQEFLATLTADLLDPRPRLMDALVSRYIVQGALAIRFSAQRLKANFAKLA